MTTTPLTDFFDENIAPQFDTYGWAAPEVNALRGAFLMGAKFVIDNAETDGTHDMLAEVEAFQAKAAKSGTDH